MDTRAQFTAIGALADATRRSLYDFVAAQGGAVSRDHAAAALGLPKHTVSFHLDRLADEGLLDVEFRRLSGRSGPGAGRPSKLYRRARREFTLTLPPRRYDLVGDILAAAVARASGGEDLERAIAACAHAEGVSVGQEGTGLAEEPSLAELADVLATQGYEPTMETGKVVLANCPFDSLARKHTDLVCGVNRSFVQGVADGLACRHAVADLDPQPDRCCVTVRKDGDR